MTRTMDITLQKVDVVKNWLEDHAEDAPEWKARLVRQKLEEIMVIIDTMDRRR